MVVGNSPGFSTRPTVRIVYDSEGEPLPVPFDLELARETTLMINQVVSLSQIEELTRHQKENIRY